MSENPHKSTQRGAFGVAMGTFLIALQVSGALSITLLIIAALAAVIATAKEQ